METIYKFRNTLTLYRDKIDILVAPNQLHEFVRKKHWAFLLYVLFSKGKIKFPFTLTLSLKKLDFNQVMTLLHL